MAKLEVKCPKCDHKNMSDEKVLISGIEVYVCRKCGMKYYAVLNRAETEYFISIDINEARKYLEEDNAKTNKDTK
jgi:transposase-like protein